MNELIKKAIVNSGCRSGISVALVPLPTLLGRRFQRQMIEDRSGVTIHVASFERMHGSAFLASAIMLAYFLMINDGTNGVSAYAEVPFFYCKCQKSRSTVTAIN